MAACVVALVCQDSAQGGVIEKRSGAGGNIYPGSEEARAEGSWLRVVDQQSAVQRLRLFAGEESIKASGGLKLSHRAGQGSGGDDQSQTG